MDRHEVVITGLSVFSPIGVGPDAFWNSLVEGRGAVKTITSWDTTGMPVCVSAEVTGFEPKEYVRPRKSIKLMSRDSQFSVAGAELACESAGLAVGSVDPERWGVVYGADRIRNPFEDSAPTYRACSPEGVLDMSRWGTDGMSASFPLGMLKLLPNMLGSHISIAWDARGPNNTLHLAENSALLAVTEAARVIERGTADCMFTGAASARLHPYDWIRYCLTMELARDADPPEATCRPFDANRSGAAIGEGAATFVLESRRHAEGRGAKILATVIGAGSSATMPQGNGQAATDALARAIKMALADARLTAADIGHVNANGMGTRTGDLQEARALHALLPGVPVTALKGYFGSLGAAGGAVEMAASVLGLDQGLVPPTLNCDDLDPACPLNLVRGQAATGTAPTALLISQTMQGQASALILRAE